MLNTVALAVSIVAGAVAQLSLKAGLSISVGYVNAQIIFGLFCYVTAMVAWIIALKKYELGFAYPLLSLGYVLVYVGAFCWPGLDESINWNKTIGLILIAAGVTACVNSNFFDRNRHADDR